MGERERDVKGGEEKENSMQGRKTQNVVKQKYIEVTETEESQGGRLQRKYERKDEKGEYS